LAALGDRLSTGLHDPATVLPLVVIAAFVARFAWLDVPHGSLIFDEAYYVQAARTLLGWAVPAGAHYAGSPPGIDPNTEHPPLGKLLMAASMLVLGDNGYGRRLPSLVAGMVALWAVYRIVRTGGESVWLGTLVVGLLGLENLTLVHGRIATLDMLALAPVLVGSWLAMRGRWALAGVAVAIGLLIKLTAVYAVGAILLLFVLDEAGGWLRTRRLPIRTLRGPAVFVGVTAVLWIVGLAALDARFSSYTSVLDHVRHMLDYGATLAGSVAQTQHCPGTESYPWQWIFNDCQIPYLRVDVSVSVGDQLVSSRPSIDFRGAMNPILAGLIPLSAMFAAWYAWRADSRVARWAVAWGAANYVPYLILAATTRRVMYLYYMLPVVPAIAVAITLLLLRAGLPRPVRWAFIAAYVVGFLAYYPFRQIP
jgi:4-amino-4-deoxy-L-arabinose transferase-like glycosyltransferase